MTTLSQNVPVLARTAVRLVLELLETQEQAVCTRKLVAPTLIERSTCRALTPEEMSPAS